MEINLNKYTIIIIPVRHDENPLAYWVCLKQMESLFTLNPIYTRPFSQRKIRPLLYMCSKSIKIF